MKNHPRWACRNANAKHSGTDRARKHGRRRPSCGCKSCQSRPGGFWYQPYSRRYTLEES